MMINKYHKFNLKDNKNLPDEKTNHQSSCFYYSAHTHCNTNKCTLIKNKIKDEDRVKKGNFSGNILMGKWVHMYSLKMIEHEIYRGEIISYEV